jgi:gamma-tubulin complex component 2
MESTALHTFERPLNATIMSSANTRVASQSDRRTAASDLANGAKSRLPAGLGGSRSDKPDGRQSQSQSPQTSGTSSQHKRMASGSQRTSRNVEERRTERVQVTTRETITSRTKSPERRPPSSMTTIERPRQPEINKHNTAEPRPKSTKSEPPQGSKL